MKYDKVRAHNHNLSTILADSASTHGHSYRSTLYVNINSSITSSVVQTAARADRPLQRQIRQSAGQLVPATWLGVESMEPIQLAGAGGSDIAPTWTMKMNRLTRDSSESRSESESDEGSKSDEGSESDEGVIDPRWGTYDDVS
jgi:hypothetical protein